MALNSVSESCVHWISFPPPVLTQNSWKIWRTFGILQVKVLGGRSLSNRFLRYKNLFHPFLFFFIFIYFLPWNDPMAKRNVLLSRSMYREIILFQAEPQKKKKVQTGSLTLRFSHCPLQIILLWLDNVLVPLAFRDICGWFASWLLYWLHVWSFQEGFGRQTDVCPFSLAVLWT